MMNQSTNIQTSTLMWTANFRPRWSPSLLLAAFILLMPFECDAQSDIRTPHTGEVACAQILRLQQKGVIALYERKYGESETKRAMADYNRCKYDDNNQAARSLKPAAKETIATLRKYLEDYFSAKYAMLTIEVGGGNPFELDDLDSQSAIEDLIGKAIGIYSKPLGARPALRADADAIISRLESKMPEMTAPFKAEAIFNDANSEEGRDEIRDTEQRHQAQAVKLRQGFQKLRTLIPALPDALALLTAEVIVPKN